MKGQQGVIVIVEDAHLWSKDIDQRDSAKTRAVIRKILMKR
jgi:hypothetical protein